MDDIDWKKMSLFRLMIINRLNMKIKSYDVRDLYHFMNRRCKFCYKKMKSIKNWETHKCENINIINN